MVIQVEKRLAFLLLDILLQPIRMGYSRLLNRIDRLYALMLVGEDLSPLTKPPGICNHLLHITHSHTNVVGDGTSMTP